MISPPDSAVSILLVDDNRVDQLSLARILQPLGERLVSVSTGEEALRALLQEEFAAVLMAVSLPDVSGFEAAQLIHSRERSRAVPVILLSGTRFTTAEVALDEEAGGPVDFLLKPVDPRVVRTKVRSFAHLHRRERRLRELEVQVAQQARSVAYAGTSEAWNAAQLVRNLPGLAYRARTGREGPLAFASEGARWLTGYGPEELTATGRGVRLADLVHPEDAWRVRETVRAALAARRSFQCEYRLRTRDGRLKPVFEQGHPVFSDTGALLWVEGVVVDVSGRDESLLRAQG